MATNFPTSLDSYTTHNSGDTISEAHINNPQDAIEALEAKVGVDSSAVNTSLDFKVNNFFVLNTRQLWLYENTAPTGWTYQSLTDKVLAVKGGTQAYNVSGGNTAGTWQTSNHTLTAAETPSLTGNATGADHSHTFSGTTPKYGTSGIGGSYGTYLGGNTLSSYGSVGINTSGSLSMSVTVNSGGGGAHNHGSAQRPSATVGIIVKYTG